MRNDPTPSRLILIVFSLFGILANLWIIALLTMGYDQTRWVYHDLRQNPRAFFREIDPVTIASLQDLRPIWFSFSALTLAAGFGLVLALNLLVAAIRLPGHPDSANRRFAQYRRCKPVGILLTLTALFWASYESQCYWDAATRHHPVNGGPPFITATILALGALIPWWYIGKRNGVDTAP